MAAAQGGQISLARADGVGGGEAAAAAPTEAEAEASARFQLALLLLERAKREEALAELKKAVVLDSQNWLIRKQMWALETPDAFYAGDVDSAWQKVQQRLEAEGLLKQ